MLEEDKLDNFLFCCYNVPLRILRPNFPRYVAEIRFLRSAIHVSHAGRGYGSHVLFVRGFPARYSRLRADASSRRLNFPLLCFSSQHDSSLWHDCSSWNGPAEPKFLPLWQPGNELSKLCCQLRTGSTRQK